MGIQKFLKFEGIRFEAIKYSFKKIKENFLSIFLLLIIKGTIFLLLFDLIITYEDSLLLFSFSLATLMYLFFTTPWGWRKIGLKFCDNEEVGPLDLFISPFLLSKMFFASIISSLLGFLPFPSSIFLGIPLAIRFQFFPYFIIDRGCSPKEAFEESWELTRGFFDEIFSFNILRGGLNFIGELLYLIGIVFTLAFKGDIKCLFGIISMLIGLFFVFPLSIIAETFLYRQILFIKLSERFNLNN